MKIRHVLPADGLRAVYAVAAEPYYRDVPCLERALVARQYTDTDGRVTLVDETVGRVAQQGAIVCADQPTDGSVFLLYLYPGLYAEAELERVYEQAATYGRELAAYYEREERRNGFATGEDAEGSDL